MLDTIFSVTFQARKSQVENSDYQCPDHPGPRESRVYASFGQCVCESGDF